jgi:Zn-dependent M28 family amino/carboxypeptidase
MIGGHFDSTHGSVGATDNATGVAAMMEVMRIFQELGIRPRRTVRIALWGGEEQGLIGSRVHVSRNFASRDMSEVFPDYENLSAYFNIDNGTGRIVGIWLQGNLAVKPIFEQWMTMLDDLGMDTAGPRSVGGTDHGSFDAVGLPGFQFMQDRLEYNSRTHHSNMDFYDRVQEDHVVQQAVVAAVFAYNTAMRDEKLPRKPMER